MAVHRHHASGEKVEYRGLGAEARASTSAVVPDKRSEAERRSGTHTHRKMIDEDSEWEFCLTLLPGVMGPRVRGDDSGYEVALPRLTLSYFPATK
ncbi:hypothetical protein ABH991_002851 [Bradyrhizobium ottawaense]|uniref:Uncharacterized protein n=1 Tax=Bradyrhizobium ottawaense TaxID=931866 RepID=A0ABV4FKD9_9BRAD|nr:hypothetical protein SG09_26300 [Bradyrhizobium ottawaense]BBO10349.1 hypothetical protein TM102_18190 [Bradyrhizobium sp. TM102]GMO31145.1 hypothetical protein BwSF21_33440 [Bradyrhizobium ottawaense]GMO35155.1 hypothetical protein BwSH14_40210 [Bradyrhizobium ottawaense]GMO73062.1 hypothetical protein BwSF19_13850 [Bradyrhizobium ottawaense]